MVDLYSELVHLGDTLLSRMKDGKWRDVSACIVLADAFAPMSGWQSFTHPRFRGWLGATSGGTARVVVLFSNPDAYHPLNDVETELLVGPDGVFVDRAGPDRCGT